MRENIVLCLATRELPKYPFEDGIPSCQFREDDEEEDSEDEDEDDDFKHRYSFPSPTLKYLSVYTLGTYRFYLHLTMEYPYTANHWESGTVPLEVARKWENAYCEIVWRVIKPAVLILKDRLERLEEGTRDAGEVRLTRVVEREVLILEVIGIHHILERLKNQYAQRLQHLFAIYLHHDPDYDDSTFASKPPTLPFPEGRISYQDPPDVRRRIPPRPQTPPPPPPTRKELADQRAVTMSARFAQRLIGVDSVYQNHDHGDRQHLVERSQEEDEDEDSDGPAEERTLAVDDEIERGYN